MRDDDQRRRFELLALPHLDAAYNLTRWLTGNAADAEDVVQEAYLRAFRYFDTFRGGDMRLWLLVIVRNSFTSWMQQSRSSRLVFSPDAPVSEEDNQETIWSASPRDPEALLLARIDATALDRMMQRLPAEYREVVVLREQEDLSYREISEVASVPIGTVMSRLSRARSALRRMWLSSETEGADGL